MYIQYNMYISPGRGWRPTQGGPPPLAPLTAGTGSSKTPATQVWINAGTENRWMDNMYIMIFDLLLEVVVKRKKSLFKDEQAQEESTFTVYL